MPPTTQDKLTHLIKWHLAQHQSLLPKPGRDERGWHPGAEAFEAIARGIAAEILAVGYAMARPVEYPDLGGVQRGPERG